MTGPAGRAEEGSAWEKCAAWSCSSRWTDAYASILSPPSLLLFNLAFACPVRRQLSASCSDAAPSSQIISFHLHHNITIVFQILCEADNQTSSSPPPASSELTGSILLDGHTFANFSIPAPLPSAAPQNFSLPLEVHQWFETNIVLRCHQAQPASLQAKYSPPFSLLPLSLFLSCSLALPRPPSFILLPLADARARRCVGLTRTASLHEKHYFTVAIWRSSDPELNTWNTTGAIGTALSARTSFLANVRDDVLNHVWDNVLNHAVT